MPNLYVYKQENYYLKRLVFFVVPQYVSNKVIKLNGINYFGKKVLKKEANSQQSFDATKHHRFMISHLPQHVVIDIEKENVISKGKNLVPGSRSHGEVSTSYTNSTPNRNERIVISGDNTVTFNSTV